MTTLALIRLLAGLITVSDRGNAVLASVLVLAIGKPKSQAVIIEAPKAQPVSVTI